MESSRTVPNLTEEEEQRLADYLLQRTRSYTSHADTAVFSVSAHAISDSKERAEKACATLEGILLLISVAESFHKQIQAVTKSIADKTNVILDLCSHLQVTNDYATEKFMDVLQYKFHVMIHEPKDILNATPIMEPSANPLLALTDQMVEKMASVRDSQLHPKHFSSELENVLIQFELDKTDHEVFEKCMRYAGEIEIDLEEQTKLQEALNLIAYALDHHAIATIMHLTAAIGISEDAELLTKRDQYLQKFGAYKYGKILLATLIATANATKTKSHDEYIHKLGTEIADICIKHIPDIFKNKMETQLHIYDELPESSISSNIKVTIKALKLMKYTVVNDFAKIAILRITRGNSPRKPPTFFSKRLLHLLDEHRLASKDKEDYKRCVQLANEIDIWIFGLAKLHFMKKNAAFWLDYNNNQYNKIIFDLLQEINDGETVNDDARLLCETYGVAICKSLIEMIEYKLSHGISEIHHHNLQKSHNDYPSHSELSQSGTLKYKNKSSKLLMLGKFASKNFDDDSDHHVLTISQIRSYEKLRQLLLNAVEATAAKQARRENDDTTPHSNLPDKPDGSPGLPGSPYNKHH